MEVNIIGKTLVMLLNKEYFLICPWAEIAEPILIVNCSMMLLKSCNVQKTIAQSGTFFNHNFKIYGASSIKGTAKVTSIIYAYLHPSSDAFIINKSLSLPLLFVITGLRAFSIVLEKTINCPDI